jgi:hypothetical protein
MIQDFHSCTLISGSSDVHEEFSKQVPAVRNVNKVMY